MRLRSRRVLLVIAALLVAAAVPIAMYELQTRSHRSVLAQIVEELDSKGEPWRLVDLEKLRRPITDERNSAPIIRRAKVGSLWKLMPDSQELELLPCQSLPADVCLKFREAFEQCNDQLKEARTLVVFPEGQFSYEIAPDVISTLIPHVQEVREVAILLKHDAWWQTQQADFAQAAASCRGAVHASRSLRDELFIISHLVRHAMLREVADTVERLCAEGQPDAKSLDDLQRLIAEEAAFDGWELALKGERASMHQLFGLIGEGKVDMRLVRGLMGTRPASWREVISERFPAPSAAQSHAWLLRHFTDLLAAHKLSPPERTAKLKEIGKQAENAPDLARILMASPWKKLADHQPRLESKLRCTATGLAAERFRRQNQRWPDSLQALVPEFLPTVPRDPYDGEPLRLRSTKDGIAVFSPGPDGVFAGDAWDRQRSEPDWGNRHEHEFRLWNVEQRRK